MVPTYSSSDPDFERRVRSSFARQALMRTLGATLIHIAPGEVEIEIPFREDLTQQHGYTHAGVITAIVDSACGYAALSLMPSGTEVLTVEYKVNFVAPARGVRFVGRGRVVRPGRTVTACTGEVLAINNGKKVEVAVMLATMMAVPDREGAAPAKSKE